MGRKEERRLKKIKGEKLGKARPSEISLTPMRRGNEISIPVNVDNMKGPFSNLPGSMTPEEFMNVTHNLSDKELNRIIYENAKMAIREGLMPDKPTFHKHLKRSLPSEIGM